MRNVRELYALVVDLVAKWEGKYLFCKLPISPDIFDNSP